MNYLHLVVSVGVDVDELRLAKSHGFGGRSPERPGTRNAKLEVLGRVRYLLRRNQQWLGVPRIVIGPLLIIAKLEKVLKAIVSHRVCGDAEVVEVIGLVGW
jgi:hypothetical protein